MEATFRVVKMNQSEAEAEIKPVKDKPGKAVSLTSLELDSLVPPLEIYEAIKGRPYIADQMGLQEVWDLVKSDPKAEQVFGNVPKKIGAVEGWLKREMTKNFLDDTPETKSRLLKSIDKIIRYSSVGDPLDRLNLVYKFIIDSNKSRAFKKLRSALQTQSIDALIDTKTVTAETIGQLLPRK